MVCDARETRVFPTCCTSAFCGRTECSGCPNAPVLDAFKNWRERTAAVRPDWIWLPSVWVAHGVRDVLLLPSAAAGKREEGEEADKASKERTWGPSPRG